jgi:uncharacterized protein (TIGR01370 family)
MEKILVYVISLYFCMASYAWAQTAPVVQLPTKDVPPKNWVVYYGDELPPETFSPYDVVVFDSSAHPTLRPLQNRGKTLLGYLSIGEAEDYRDDFQTIKKMGVLLNENKDWPGHYYVDIRNPEWTKYLVEVKIPQILFQRFDGIMFDTLDSPLYLEELYPQKYAGMREAAVNLIKEIRMQYPQIKLMLNRGMDVMPEAAPQLDYFLLETTMADINFEKKTYKWFPESVYAEVAVEGKAAQEANPDLQVVTLDYWKPEDKDGLRKIYKTQRENGFIPYVATVDLMSVIEEPK